MSEDAVRQEPFPSPSRQATGLVNGVETEVSSMNFSDKIMVTISQGGRLAQWVQVQLAAPSSASVDMALPGAGSLLPSEHLTATTLLGGGNAERETMGQLYASQIASLLTLRNPNEQRSLLLGLGLEKVDTTTSDSFYDVVELVQQVL
ncbi:hypothetical protein GE21DRAFT_7381 [Neurospora crassa]|uniref:Uncharacterized protein n=4 Tax=Neurospora TaxID=5140 RepID=Q1K7G5_NEUCR|nr:uncharacterized protein NEUTE1DRAFT_120163 [Neurospora tetrasperma FGSC 2508]XP_961196.1 hypothetical protein NCU03807 [Neurospora crassa OR74A]EGZ74882.1 hypothetical protein NEUTE2DRAFT_155459 [Neurospora tetrasperma FGSC 2509]KAK3501549.1 hypothetical protein B0T13DRAFT_463606 [Neurospora crassa]EAA31960.1 hypothetical protein NCU03807 [Neurospora crassa OR74A]EGO61113.1 hypothetical protein NEUTE1DRAFT_120163 [Neurospora tetrasperma FGSC 2508]KHE88125.1 hypothetical protein GE21DRAFT_7|eukprot:XP_961196.1 hypothetical protein NCU03807 [Neurospora crassa OR74A]